ncbi:MAG: hypothetical protein AAGG44_08720 [Planctomycetota bacterium]
MTLTSECSSSQNSVVRFSLTAGSWIVRGLVLFSLIVLGWFVVAHLVEGGPQPTSDEWFALMLFPGTVLVGLGMCLRYPRAGAAIVACALVLFYTWSWANSGRLPTGPYFMLFAAPSFLLVAMDSLRRRWRC